MPEPARLSSSAERVLRALGKSDGLTYDELVVRVRPMASHAVLTVMYELDRAGLIRLDERDDGTASLTDAGRERVARV